MKNLNTSIFNYVDYLLTSKVGKPLWNIEAIKENRKPKWNYIDGCFLSSLIELYKITKKKKYLNFVIKYINYFVNKKGEILGYNPNNFSTDDVSESKILFNLYSYTKDKRYLKAIDFTFNQIKKHPRTKEGNFFHKAIYPNQVWLDGLYMINVFYAKYQKKFKHGNYKDIIKQFKLVRKNMFDKKYGLYYHGYDESKSIFWANKKTGLSKNFWLRSIGWYLCALIDIYEVIDINEDKKYLAKLYKELIDNLYKYIDKKSFMFYQLPIYKNLKGNYLETSGSAMISYATLKGVRLNLLNKKYRKIGENVFNGIIKKYLKIDKNSNLNLGGICLVAGLGPENNKKRNGSTKYYLSEKIVKNDAKGVGPFLMAFTEIIR